MTTSIFEPTSNQMGTRQVIGTSSATTTVTVQLDGYPSLLPGDFIVIVNNGPGPVNFSSGPTYIDNTDPNNPQTYQVVLSSTPTLNQGDRAICYAYWNNRTSTGADFTWDIDTSVFSYDASGATVYPSGSVGSALTALFGNIKTTVGVTNQITVTPATSDPTTLNFGLPTTIITPGSLTVTGQMQGGGTTTNDDAPTGYIGEFIPLNGSTSLAPAAPTAVTILAQQTLGPGDWMVNAQLQLSGSATNISYAGGSISLLPTIIDTTYFGNWMGRSGSLPTTQTVPIRRRRVTVAAGNSTTVYLLTQANFAGTNNMTITGYLDIERRR